MMIGCIIIGLLQSMIFLLLDGGREGIEGRRIIVTIGLSGYSTKKKYSR